MAALFCGIMLRMDRNEIDTDGFNQIADRNRTAILNEKDNVNSFDPMDCDRPKRREELFFTLNGHPLTDDKATDYYNKGIPYYEISNSIIFLVEQNCYLEIAYYSARLGNWKKTK